MIPELFCVEQTDVVAVNGFLDDLAPQLFVLTVVLNDLSHDVTLVLLRFRLLYDSSLDLAVVVTS